MARNSACFPHAGIIRIGFKGPCENRSQRKLPQQIMMTENTPVFGQVPNWYN